MRQSRYIYIYPCTIDLDQAQSIYTNTVVGVLLAISQTLYPLYLISVLPPLLNFLTPLFLDFFYLLWILLLSFLGSILVSLPRVPVYILLPLPARGDATDPVVLHSQTPPSRTLQKVHQTKTRCHYTRRRLKILLQLILILILILCYVGSSIRRSEHPNTSQHNCYQLPLILIHILLLGSYIHHHHFFIYFLSWFIILLLRHHQYLWPNLVSLSGTTLKSL